ncbi:unnamed protein product [Cylicocyclus nassatus]|uniref:Uncharacterized protein n=1 Tax=Cylicocyclus nassatus TaxID=53992 RepID=A0AA36DNZ9_CYLNA|nr:unnamed protein product [Cylicocyclus nassatus]
MCGSNNMFECGNPETSYTIILPTTYEPLHIIDEVVEEQEGVVPPTQERKDSSRTVSIAVPEVQRAFPEVGSFGSYGKTGLAC